MPPFLFMLFAFLFCICCAFGNELADEAVSFIGVPYYYEGRSEKCLDCLGLVFLSYSRATGKPWKNLPVNPWELVENNSLGIPVKGLDGVLAESIDYSLFERGDVVHALSTFKGEEYWKPVCLIDSWPYYGVHIGIYLGDSLWIHANPYSPFERKVLVHNIKSFLEKTGFPAVFVTRIKD